MARHGGPVRGSPAPAARCQARGRVYDYADVDVPMLARMFDRRCRGYEAIGYTVLLPASAIPGWPADVTLPADPVWKRDYSGSVRRLIRDGVDSPLATLFVHAVRPVSADADGLARARSATEAFLFRRLESLPETKGRFALNAPLPIAFDGAGTLEVDLLCADARVAVTYRVQRARQRSNPTLSANSTGSRRGAGRRQSRLVLAEPGGPTGHHHVEDERVLRTGVPSVGLERAGSDR